MFAYMAYCFVLESDGTALATAAAAGGATEVFGKLVRELPPGDGLLASPTRSLEIFFVSDSTDAATGAAFGLVGVLASFALGTAAAGAAGFENHPKMPF